jgi:hypothetical protein
MIIDNSIDSSNVNIKIRNLSGTFDIRDVYTSYSGIPEGTISASGVLSPIKRNNISWELYDSLTNEALGNDLSSVKYLNLDLLGAGPQVLKFFDINKKQNVLNVDDLNLQNLAITLADGASGAADLRHFKLKLSVIDLNDNVDYAVFDLKYPQNSFSGVDVTVDDKINISVSGSKNLLSYNLYVSDDFDIPFENTDDFVDIKSYRATKNIIYYPKKNTRYHYNLIASDLYGTGASYYLGQIKPSNFDQSVLDDKAHIISGGLVYNYDDYNNHVDGGVFLHWAASPKTNLVNYEVCVSESGKADSSKYYYPTNDVTTDIAYISYGSGAFRANYAGSLKNLYYSGQNYDPVFSPSGASGIKWVDHSIFLDTKGKFPSGVFGTGAANDLKRIDFASGSLASNKLYLNYYYDNDQDSFQFLPESGKYASYYQQAGTGYEYITGIEYHDDYTGVLVAERIDYTYPTGTGSCDVVSIVEPSVVIPVTNSGNYEIKVRSYTDDFYSDWSNSVVFTSGAFYGAFSQFYRDEVRGSGISGYIPKFSGSGQEYTSRITHSAIYEDEAYKIGINTTNPARYLEVKGTGDYGSTQPTAGITNNVYTRISSPSGYDAGLELHAGGARNVGASGPYGAVKWTLYNEGTDGCSLKFNNPSAGDVATFNYDGNLGINTTVPTNQFHVYSTDVTSSVFQTSETGSYVEFKDIDSSDNAVKIGAVDNNFVMKKGGLTRFIISGDGNVGIGSVVPQHKLHVNGDAQISGYLYDYNNTTGQAGYVLTSEENGPQWKQIEDVLSGVGGSGTANYVTKWSDEDTLTTGIIYDDGTSVGIGTTTLAEALTVNGRVEAEEFIGDLRGAVVFKANAGENISKGQAVYISGISGNKTVVSLADADDASKMPAFGVAAETASSGSDITIYTFGTLSNINTSSWTEGTELFVGTTAGELVSTAPAGESAQIQKIAKVTRQDATVGSIKIMGAGRSNATPNLNEGRLFVGNSSNRAVADDTVYVDIANSRAGINIDPDYTLHVSGDSGSAGDTNYVAYFKAPTATGPVGGTFIAVENPFLTDPETVAGIEFIVPTQAGSKPGVVQNF